MRTLDDLKPLRWGIGKVYHYPMTFAIIQDGIGWIKKEHRKHEVYTLKDLLHVILLGGLIILTLPLGAIWLIEIDTLWYLLEVVKTASRWIEKHINNVWAKVEPAYLKILETPILQGGK